MIGTSADRHSSAAIGTAKPDQRSAGSRSTTTDESTVIERGGDRSGRTSERRLRGTRLSVIPETSKCCKRAGRSRVGRVSFPRSDQLSGTGPLLGAPVRVRLRVGMFLPPAKRLWGWYVLRSWLRERFVGRIRAANDANPARMEIPLGRRWDEGSRRGHTDGVVDATRQGHCAPNFIRGRQPTQLGTANTSQAAKAAFPS